MKLQCLICKSESFIKAGFTKQNKQRYPGGEADFEYDTYGNLVKDRNKKIDKIRYNHLNLPKKITFENNDVIEYLYDANGTKLKKTVTAGTTITETQYLDGFQYEKPAGGGDWGMSFFPTAEGYVNVTHGALSPAYNYVYNYTDHLGNIRLRYTKNPGITGGLRILEEDHYYPFGLKHQGYNGEHEIFEFDENISTVVLNPVNPLTGDKYKFKFQSQERQNELGLNWDSFKWRNYDYAIGRFMVIDPLASEYAYNSSYAFQENKIGMGRELEGLEMVPERSVDRKNATITYQVKPINNSRLTSEQFKTVIEARKALTESGLTGNTDDGTYLTTNVVFSDDATITWEYNETITIKPFGAALGATKNVGDTQNNETQVNIYAHIGKDGKLGELTLDSLSEITKTGSHEDQHPGGVPDIGDGTNPELETKMSRDPKGNIMDYSNDGTNVLPEQRGLILRTAEEQYNKRD